MSNPLDAPCTIHLVRHGRTLLNKEVRFRGRIEVGLDDVGRSEAIAAGKALSGAGLAAVYSSPLGRALEVGTALATGSGLDEVVQWRDLINLDYGRWEGRTAEESEEDAPEAWAAYLNDPDRAVCPAGESLSDAADRMARTLRELGAKHRGQSIAAVTHGVMVRLAAWRVVDINPADWQFRIPTGGSLAFEVDGDNVRLVSELPEGTRTDDFAATRVTF